MRLFFLLFFSVQSVFAKQWIGIENSVLKRIEQNPIYFLKNTDQIKSAHETFYYVEDKVLGQLSHFIHHEFGRCGGYRVLPFHPNQQPKKLNKASNLLTDYSIGQQELVENYLQDISVDYMNSIVNHLTSYRTRYYKSPEGKAALKWIGKEWSRLTAHRNDANVKYYRYKNHSQPTVILNIKGKNPALKDEIIILGGHGDSINTDNLEESAPGADDNAAGIAVLSDIIRILMQKNYAPEHTVQFIAYAAEEEGIQGSYELARVYREQNKKVMGVLQFDGVNYAGKSYDMALISDLTDDRQNKFIASLLDQYLKISWTWDQCGYACSDHAAWNYEMYPASFAAEAVIKEENPYIHTANDTFDKSFNHTNHAANFTKLGLAYLLELDL